LADAIARHFNLIILDVMLPRKNGFEVCRELRRRGRDVAILMLTAKSQVIDRVTGLKLGADDYLAKPFDPAELLARVEALLRRTSRGSSPSIRSFDFGDTHVDFAAGEVHKAGSQVSLAGKEMQLLRYLIEQRGKVVSREELLQNVWEYQSDVSSRTIDVHIAWLRQKLEDQPQTPRYIHTVRGKGYKFSM
jgi:two-component system alkaline phosphatase synthesis response regulator PhoP